MTILNEKNLARLYYCVKPFLSRRAQILIRRAVAVGKRRVFEDTWPIDREAAALPAGWAGWPDGKKFAVVLTHDVDTPRGVECCLQLMALEREAGFRSSFNFVAEGYPLPPELRDTLTRNGFEVGVHGLVHTREMYQSQETFALHAEKINEYLKEWQAVGFRSPCVYHNYEWLHGLDISYDASSFDTDPFEPQSDGLKSIFPVLMQGAPREYVELPYTLPQDFSLFILLREEGIDVWKEKLRWVAEHGGMVLVLTHPDYMCFAGTPMFDQYPADYYRELLEHIRDEYQDAYWQALPKQMADYWLSRYRRSRRPAGITQGAEELAHRCAPA